MKIDRLFLVLCLGVALFCKNARGAESASSDPVADRLFSPDLVLHNGETIELSDGKREEIQERVVRAQSRFKELEQLMKKERDALVALLDQEKSDDAAILKQLDNVVAREQEIRREQFAMLLAVRSLLTPEQRTQLKGLRKTYNAAAIETKLKDKLAIIEDKIQDLSGKGRDPSSIAEKMQAFPELIRVGKVKEAEALLDRVLKELDAK